MCVCVCVCVCVDRLCSSPTSDGLVSPLVIEIGTKTLGEFKLSPAGGGWSQRAQVSAHPLHTTPIDLWTQRHSSESSFESRGEQPCGRAKPEL